MKILAKTVTSIVLIVLAFFAGVMLCQGPAEGRTLVIGRVSNNPAKNYAELKPLLDYVAAQMKDLGVTDGAVLLAKNKEEMTKLFLEGKVDWATKGIFQALYYVQASHAEILLRSWREGVPNYYTVIFARKDGGIRSLTDLKGKKIAFQDRGSTSAYFVPLAMLKRAGFEMTELVRKDLEPDIKTRLKEILLKVHEDPKAKQALKSYSSTTKFDEIEGDAKAEVEEARRMIKFIGQELR